MGLNVRPWFAVWVDYETNRPINIWNDPIHYKIETIVHIVDISCWSGQYDWYFTNMTDISSNWSSNFHMVVFNFYETLRVKLESNIGSWSRYHRCEFPHITYSFIIVVFKVIISINLDLSQIVFIEFNYCVILIDNIELVNWLLINLYITLIYNIKLMKNS